MSNEARVTILTNDRISVWCYPARGIIHHEMHKATYGAALREALEQGIVAMAKHGATKWLSDDRRNGAVPPEDLTWGDEVWFPKTVKAGWKHWALVQPDKIIGQMNMRAFVKLYGDRGVNVKVFTEPNAAMSWLMTV
jgi:hypothetical protein